MPILVTIGDSVCAGEGDLATNGWVGRLKAKLGQPWVVYNLGVCGDTVAGVAARWGEVNYRTPDYLIVAIGYNDLKISKITNTPYIGQMLVEDGWRYVLKNIKQLNIPTLIVLPWLPEDITSTRSIFNVSDVENYKNFVLSVLTEQKLPWVQAIGLTAQDYIDGVHPNAQGYDKMGEVIFAKLKELGWVNEKI